MALTGGLTLANCTALLAQADGLLASGTGPCVMDLSGTAAADSAGVSLLLEIQRRAAARGRPVSFTHAPAQLRDLAGFFGTSAFLKLA